MTLYTETMDLVANTDYLIYLSYGVFSSHTAGANEKTAVRGAVKPGYNFTPHAVTFKIPSDTKKPISTSNSGASALGLAAIVATGCALTNLI